MTMKRRRKGFSIIDTLIATGILLLGALAFCAVAPVVSRSHHKSDEMSKAVQIASWQTEQIRQLGYLDVSYSKLYALGYVENWSGTGPFIFSSAPAVSGMKFAPSVQLRSGVGEMTITDKTATLKEVAVTVKWVSANGKNMEVKLTTLIGKDS